jgi:hypothetical protein
MPKSETFEKKSKKKSHRVSRVSSLLCDILSFKVYMVPVTRLCNLLCCLVDTCDQFRCMWEWELGATLWSPPSICDEMYVIKCDGIIRLPSSPVLFGVWCCYTTKLGERRWGGWESAWGGVHLVVVVLIFRSPIDWWYRTVHTFQNICIFVKYF